MCERDCLLFNCLLLMLSVMFGASSGLILHDIIHLQRPPPFAVSSKVKLIIILPAEQQNKPTYYS